MFRFLPKPEKNTPETPTREHSKNNLFDAVDRRHRRRRRRDRPTGEPAPTPAPSSERPANDTTVAADFFFEDKPLRISEGGFDLGVAALALLGLLTFFPVCVK